MQLRRRLVLLVRRCYKISLMRLSPLSKAPPLIIGVRMAIWRPRERVMVVLRGIMGNLPAPILPSRDMILLIVEQDAQRINRGRVLRLQGERQAPPGGKTN